MEKINQEVLPYRSSLLKNGAENDYIECKGAVFVRLRNVRKSIEESLRHPARIDSFVLFYCTRGHLRFTSRLQDFEMVENTFFWGAHSVMQFKDCSDDCELYAIAFNQNFAAQMNIDFSHILPLISAFENGPRVFVAPHDHRVSIERGFNRILESSLEVKGSQLSYADLAIAHLFASIFYSLCIMLASDMETVVQVSIKNRTTEYFERLMRLLGEHYKTERSVEFYADKMSITPKHLSRVVRSHSGRSVHQWIDAFVVQEIKNLLKHSNLSIQQISYELQFSNPSFMGQYFKRITGKTPGEYRREL